MLLDTERTLMQVLYVVAAHISFSAILTQPFQKYY